MILFTVLCAFVSFSVDYGRVQVAKSQLQQAADAAALSAIQDLDSGATAAQNSAIATAAFNSADGRPVNLNSSTDIEFGSWNNNTNTFTVLPGSAAAVNAVRVTTRRTAANGNAIPLFFALGRSSCDVHSSAIAYKTSNSGGYIGISLTRMYNTARFDAYNSRSGPYSLATAQQGNLLSYSDMWLYDNSRVYGEAHWDLTGTFNHDSTAIVSPGPMTAEKLNPNFPPVALGNVASVNDNGQLTQYYSGNQLVIPNGKPPVTFPAGTYYFTKFDLGDNNTVNFDGPTVIYLKCGGDITSTLGATSRLPSDLAIKVAPNYNWKIDSGGTFYGTFYNPTGDVHHHNGGQSFGSVISDLLCFRQNSQGHQDLSLGKYATAAAKCLAK